MRPSGETQYVICWYEVAALMYYFSHRYISEMLIALQGVYIFWALICRRRKFNIVFGEQKVDRVMTKVYR